MLGAINLSAFVENGEFDYTSFEKTITIAVKALNDVLDEGMMKHPLKEQRDSVRDWRQIGLGIMGLADMLIKMGMRYGSVDSIDLCDKIGGILASKAIFASAKLAQDEGAYPKFDRRVYDTNFYQLHCFGEYRPIRNSQLLTIAPTGTISTMIGVSGGIEPIFANSYTRMTKSLHGHDEAYKVYTPIVKDYMEKHGITDEAELPIYFVTSADIPIEARIEMQGVWQSHIDASISSTVNLPHEATIEDVEKLYMLAWKKGLKGVTVYRAGCAREGILTTDTTIEETTHSVTPLQIPRGVIMQCSNDLVGKKRKLMTGCGSLHVLGFFDPSNGELQEVYLSKGSTGGCNNYMIGLSRMISLLCRAGVDIYTIKDQLDSTGACPSYAVRSATHHDTSRVAVVPWQLAMPLLICMKR